ncbi:MAG: Periplasmic binding protein [Methanothrix sp.]|jgi:iron complex transport system substrate-binding protein|nr:MAG: Periplasmic binding protein [Methanothrix sp.]
MNNLSYIYMTLTLCVCLLMMGVSVAEKSLIPGDLDGDMIVSAEELEEAKGALERGDLADDELALIKRIHEEYPRTVVDFSGREVTIYRPVERVVCTASQHIESLRSLRVPAETIVGIPEGANREAYFAEFAAVPSIGHFYEADVERILELQPDLIIAHPGPGPGGNSLEELLGRMRVSGVPVISLKCNIPETYPDEMRALGKIFERAEEAEEFIQFYEGVLQGISARTASIPPEGRPKVYTEWKPYNTNSILDMGEVEMAGGVHIFAGGRPVREVESEAVMVSDPDVIIRLVWDRDYDAIASDDISSFTDATSEILGRPELVGVKAVKEGRVYAMASPFWTYLPGSSCRHFIGVAYMAKWFYPDLFEDLDPQAIHQRYLTQFQGLDYDLEERGAFAYPPPA